jgi:nucleotide-binding universal stress UspA family protein
MSSPIVVGTDGSEPAARAVAWAADEAVRRDLPLRIVHAISPSISDIPATTPPGFRLSLNAEGEHVLSVAAVYARENRPGLQVTMELIHDTTAHALREQVADAFELVVGHRGLGGFAGMLLGSVSLRVAGRAAGPVVVVRGGPGQVYHEVVAGVDPGQEPDVVLSYAFDAASVRHAQLRIVHGWQLSPTLAGAGWAVDVDEVERSYRTALDQVIEPWRDRFPDVKVVEQTPLDHPVHALTEASRDADLVVVGARSRGGLTEMLLGSVSHGILHHAHSPVAVVRPRD